MLRLALTELDMAKQFVIDILPGPASSVGLRRCSGCGSTMRFVGIEPHPTLSGADLYTLHCFCGVSDADTIVRH